MKIHQKKIKAGKNLRKSAFVLCLVILLATVGLGSITNAQRRVQNDRRPRKVRLVLGIVIDQFRYDYLTRFGDLFEAGGFRRLLNQGAVFTNANYIYLPTVTAPGHATFMSGSIPALNGIVGNEWFDRGSGRNVMSTTDTSVKLLGGVGEEPASPSRLIGSTVGDQLRLSNNNQSKVVGVAFKERAAVLPAGKRPNGAYWFDSILGTFVSSNYYFPDLPNWVKEFNQNNRPDKLYYRKEWKLLRPAADYQRSLPDDSPYEQSPRGDTFPRIIESKEATPGKEFYENFEESPFANDYTAAFAKAAIDGEKLGQDDYTDLLTVSFSANDKVGHTFGPYSQEVEDITLRTDLLLGELFKYIDQRIGLENTIIVLTADHGVAPLPEHSRDLGLGGGKFASKDLTSAIQAGLDKRFGAAAWIRATVNGNVYFNYDVIERQKVSRQEVERVGCEAALKFPGIGFCFTRTELTSGPLPPGAYSEAAARGFNAERSGDMVIVVKPFYMQRSEIGTTHSTPYRYDTHVPVIFYGAGVAAGSYANPSSPSDIAPTLSTLLGIEPPSNTVGRVLTEAIKPKVKP
ncbi:MAG TPA: alkaline phosphatase family protein [Pyrinomonadaceae bacterium]|nr:alkaline phosphatase family protein [Pyrinomonadaceae bacterium]